MDNYKVLYDSLIKDFYGKDFLFTNKMLKHHRIYKFLASISFVVLGISLVPFFHNQRFTIAIIGILGILFFENRIRNIKEFLNNDKNSLEKKFKNYLNSVELTEYREKIYKELEIGSITKRDYLSIIKEELQLIYHLIKDECEVELNIDIITYKNDVEHIFKMLNSCLDSNLINKEDFNQLKKRWVSDIQILCNQYVKTEFEIDLKYLQCIN